MKRSEPQSKGTLKYGKRKESSFYEVNFLLLKKILIVIEK